MNIFANNALDSIKSIDDFIAESEVNVALTLNDIYDKTTLMQEHATEEYNENEFYQESVLAGALIGGGIISVIAAAIALFSKVLKKEATTAGSSDSKSSSAELEDEITLLPEEARKKSIKKLQELLAKNDNKVKMKLKLNMEALEGLVKQSEEVTNALIEIAKHPTEPGLIAKLNTGDYPSSFKKTKVIVDSDEYDFTTEELSEFDNIAELIKTLNEHVDKAQSSVSKAAQNLKKSANGENSEQENQKADNSENTEKTLQEITNAMVKCNNDAMQDIKKYFRTISKNTKAEIKEAEKSRPNVSDTATENTEQNPAPAADAQETQNAAEQTPEQNAEVTPENTPEAEPQQQPQTRSLDTDTETRIQSVATQFINKQENAVTKKQRGANGAITDVSNGPVIKYNATEAAADLENVILAMNSGESTSNAIENAYNKTDYEHALLLNALLHTKEAAGLGIKPNDIPNVPATLIDNNPGKTFEPKPFDWSNIDLATNEIKNAGNDPAAIKQAAMAAAQNITASTTQVNVLNQKQIDSINNFVAACNAITDKAAVGNEIGSLLNAVNASLKSAKKEYQNREMAAQNQGYTAETNVGAISDALTDASNVLIDAAKIFNPSPAPVPVPNPADDEDQDTPLDKTLVNSIVSQHPAIFNGMSPEDIEKKIKEDIALGTNIYGAITTASRAGNTDEVNYLTSIGYAAGLDKQYLKNANSGKSVPPPTPKQGPQTIMVPDIADLLDGLEGFKNNPTQKASDIQKKISDIINACKTPNLELEITDGILDRYVKKITNALNKIINNTNYFTAINSIDNNGLGDMMTNISQAIIDPLSNIDKSRLPDQTATRTSITALNDVITNATGQINPTQQNEVIKLPNVGQSIVELESAITNNPNNTTDLKSKLDAVNASFNDTIDVPKTDEALTNYITPIKKAFFNMVDATQIDTLAWNVDINETENMVENIGKLAETINAIPDNVFVNKTNIDVRDVDLAKQDIGNIKNTMAENEKIENERKARQAVQDAKQQFANATGYPINDVEALYQQITNDIKSGNTDAIRKNVTSLSNDNEKNAMKMLLKVAGYDYDADVADHMWDAPDDSAGNASASTDTYGPSVTFAPVGNVSGDDVKAAVNAYIKNLPGGTRRLDSKGEIESALAGLSNGFESFMNNKYATAEAAVKADNSPGQRVKQYQDMNMYHAFATAMAPLFGKTPADVPPVPSSLNPSSTYTAQPASQQPTPVNPAPAQPAQQQNIFNNPDAFRLNNDGQTVPNLQNAAEGAQSRKDAAREANGIANKSGLISNIANGIKGAANKAGQILGHLTNRDKPVAGISYKESAVIELDDGTTIIHEEYIVTFEDGTTETVILES